jgi:anoctamin-10
VPYLDVFSVTVRPFVSKEDEKTIDHADFRIDPGRLRKQIIYFTVTAQIVNLALETVVPFILRKLSLKYREFTEERQEEKKTGGSDDGNKKSVFVYDDPPDEVDFLARVRNEAELPEYDVTTDLREMCIQFGYLSLFSPVWPLVPVSFLINNWIELRSDFFKICKECKRPTPERADTIGPWLDTMGFLAWFGSITSSALVYMFSNDDQGPDGKPSEIRGWALLLTVFFAEHIYLAIRYVVEATLSKIETPSIREERAQQFLLRKNYLGETAAASGIDISDTATTEEEEFGAIREKDEDEEAITRDTLEEDARQQTLQAANPWDRFWRRQKNWKEAAQVGARIIESRSHGTSPSPERKKQQ